MRGASRVCEALAVVMIVVTTFAGPVRAPDTTPPVIGGFGTNPGPHRVGSPVQIWAQAADDTGIATASVNVSQPDGTSVNATMTLQFTSYYTYMQNWTQVGLHAFTVWVVDSARNAASRSGSFTVYPPDTVPPVLADIVAFPATQAPGGEVTVAGRVTDDQWLYGYLKVNVTQPDGVTRDCTHYGYGDTVSLVFWCTRIYVQVGLYLFLVTASDEAGNVASAGGSFRIAGATDTTPPTITGAGASPASQVAGGSVTVHATVTDDILVESASVDVTQPDGTSVNAAMRATGDLYVFSALWTQVGSHSFTILAVDGAGNLATASGSFAIRFGGGGPPTIAAVDATPPTQIPGGSLAITATVTDDLGVASVSVNITGPGVTSVNATMTVVGSTYTFTAIWLEVGPYSFTIWAGDVAGIWASAGGSFAIAQSVATPPTIHHAPPPTVYADDPLRIDAYVTDDDGVEEVRLVYTPVDGEERNVTMTPSGGLYTLTVPGQSGAGIIRYRIYAVDAIGSSAVSELYSVSVRGRPSAPAFDAGPIAVALWILAAILVLATGLAAAGFVATRRVLRRQTEPPKPPPDS